MHINNKQKNILAPIVLIAFNRANHFKQTLSALAKNKEAKDSMLYICIDGPRNLEEKKNQKEMCDYVEIIRTQFLNIKIIKQNYNIGLAKNMIQNVTSIVNKHGKLIVIEDDDFVSEAFLKFMNDALTYYEPHKKVWHIASHTFVNNHEKINDVFLHRVMYCWGWATWKDRWSFFEKDPEALINEFTNEDIKKFNLDDTEPFWSQVLNNYSGHINTWAIFWYATIFKNKGLCMNPFYSYVRNIGLDGSGVHKNINKKLQDLQVINNDGKFNPQIDIEENFLAVNEIKKYYLNNSSSLKKITRSLIILFLNRRILGRLQILWYRIRN